MCFLRGQQFISFFITMLTCAIAVAQENPVIFEQSRIRIDPVLIEKDPNAPIELRSSIAFDVEVRAEDAAKLEYLPSLSTLAEHQGAMVVFTAPILTALPRWNNFIAVDALMLAEDGTILSITPSVVLAELPDQELSADPVKALLFLKAGTTAARGILVKDVVAGNMFAATLHQSSSGVNPAQRLQSPQTPAPADNHPQGLDELLRDAEVEAAPAVQP